MASAGGPNGLGRRPEPAQKAHFLAGGAVGVDFDGARRYDNCLRIGKGCTCAYSVPIGCWDAQGTEAAFEIPRFVQPRYVTQGTMGQ